MALGLRWGFFLNLVDWLALVAFDLDLVLGLISMVERGYLVGDSPVLLI